MGPLARTAAALATGLALATGARAQVPLAIDPGASSFTYDGDTSIGPIVGVPSNTFAMTGGIDVDVTVSGGAIVAGQFLGGDGATIPATLSAEIPNPIPIFPPLIEIDIVGLHVAPSSAPFAVGAGGSFTTDVVVTVLAGTLDVRPLLGSPTSEDLTGLVSDPSPVTGTLELSASGIHLVLPIDIVFPIDDPSTGVTGEIHLAGTIDASRASFASFCSGDGSGTACPCGNSSAAGSGNGCLNSFGTGGRLVASGIASVGADSVVLAGSGMPPTATTLFFQGDQRAGGGAGTVFGDGLLCATGSVIRLGAKINAGGASMYPEGANQPISVRGQIPPAGGTRWYQAWYRNSAPFCTSGAFNLTNGVEIRWVP